jgi:hypothetical protein
MDVAEPIVRSRRVRQFRTTAEKRHIVEETVLRSSIQGILLHLALPRKWNKVKMKRRES